MKIPELLSPAANFACAEAAFNHGADAVYVGFETFNLRARSNNFNKEELAALLDLAYSLDRKVYVTLNIMPNDAMLLHIENFLESLKKMPRTPHALIVSDPGVVLLCQKYVPHIDLHLSTQTGTFNRQSVDFWQKQGVQRVILPRELSCEQIAVICKASTIEMEVFVHGAMCMSISGRCLIGAYYNGRHPNFGDCPQPCRFKYQVSPMPDNAVSNGEWYTVEEDFEAYLFNSKDLNTLDILDKIVQTGVSCLKIEGRNRSVHYVSSVVKVYRAALDSLQMQTKSYDVDPAWANELDLLDHRPYTTGFFCGEKVIQDVKDSRPKHDKRIVGVVRGVLEGKGVVIDVKNPFAAEDIVSVLPIKKGKDSFLATILQCTDLNGNYVERALTNRLVVIQSDPALAVGDMIRK